MCFGARDWFGVLVGGLWVVAGAVWAWEGESPNLAGASALITLLWIGGTLAARRTT